MKKKKLVAQKTIIPCALAGLCCFSAILGRTSFVRNSVKADELSSDSEQEVNDTNSVSPWIDCTGQLGPGGPAKAKIYINNPSFEV